ncbi:efflux RND transporter periplasmic adaptor subunit [Bacteroides thetaiotaomicron]|uniref:efflux RND transporter periplasmic adaptor subunit n=1 Tax=Bacteroides thetaiotaomicron TaxID=818 RepID=UPI002165726A|nr:efflux RND transporter periplasmic adaptor subunit [Bacteroides thetaiotaomicron]MCS2873858.1 efflux RND transporter periplasmic adaptor subunit [Bacteroides thetaiotaomicron]MDL2215022.1 efflux RND transporter periplasmic adaptor subunit [Dysgonomonas sp. OttesenSCG-928-M03]
MMMKIKMISLVCLSVFLLFYGCKNGEAKREIAKTVKVSTAIVHGEEKTTSFPGKVKAASEIDLAFRINGPITKINVTEGQFVRKGEVIAEMDSRDYYIQLSATEAEYKQVKSEAERIIQLYEKQSVSDNDYDKAVSGLRQVTAKYEAHKNALSDTKLIAPFDGYIQKRYFNKAEVISAGMPVFSMISTEVPEVEINIPASEYIRKEKFESFYCHFDTYPDKMFPLELISVNQKANLNQLYTVRFRLKTTNNQQMPSPGMSSMVTIKFKPESSDLVSIPLAAVFEQNGKQTVWIYNDEQKTVQARTIRMSEIPNNGTVIVSEGISPGEKVISAGVYSLIDGCEVKLLPEVSSTNIGGIL